MKDMEKIGTFRLRKANGYLTGSYVKDVSPSEETEFLLGTMDLDMAKENPDLADRFIKLLEDCIKRVIIKEYGKEQKTTSSDWKSPKANDDNIIIDPIKHFTEYTH